MKLTPKDHGDRLQLQIALTELDTLTHRLNDTKRDSENRLEAGRLLAQIGSRQSLKADNQDVCMIRHDDIVEVVCTACSHNLYVQHVHKNTSTFVFLSYIVRLKFKICHLNNVPNEMNYLNGDGQ